MKITVLKALNRLDKEATEMVYAYLRSLCLTAGGLGDKDGIGRLYQSVKVKKPRTQ